MNLPTPPDGHHYEVVQESKLLAKVWLVRDKDSQLLEKPIRTIYCFIKGSKNLTVHKPKSAKQAYIRKHCSIDELVSQNPYSLHNPTEIVSLWHLK